MYNKNSTDFYIRYPDHPNYSPEVIFVQDPIDIIVNKIEMILFTNKGDVLGDRDFGANLEYYVYKTKVNESVIKAELESQFSKYIPELSTISYSIDVTFFRDPERYQDLGIVTINLPGKEISTIIG